MYGVEMDCSRLAAIKLKTRREVPESVPVAFFWFRVEGSNNIEKLRARMQRQISKRPAATLPITLSLSLLMITMIISIVYIYIYIYIYTYTYTHSYVCLSLSLSLCVFSLGCLIILFVRDLEP